MVAVGAGVGVAVGDGVGSGVAVGVGSGVSVGVGVAVGSGAAVGSGVSVGALAVVAVGTGVSVGASAAAATGTAVAAGLGAGGGSDPQATAANDIMATRHATQKDFATPAMDCFILFVSNTSRAPESWTLPSTSIAGLLATRSLAYMQHHTH